MSQPAPSSSQVLWGDTFDWDMAAEEEATRQADSGHGAASSSGGVAPPPSRQDPPRKSQRQSSRPTQQPDQPLKRPSMPPNATGSSSQVDERAPAPSPDDDVDIFVADPDTSSSDDEGHDPIRRLPADKGKSRKGVQVRKVQVSPNAPRLISCRPACDRLRVAAEGRCKTH